MRATQRCLVALLVLAASCATASPVDGVPGGTVADQPVAKNPNVISKAELQDPIVNGMDLLRAVRQLRPGFFRPSGPQSFSNAAAGEVLMSQDFGPVQPVKNLSLFNTMDIHEVRYLGMNEAATRFGLNANGGPVIVLLSTKQP
ncbi:MAG: hypothetical protein JWL95_1865 [Gemmatimonadetes bacterium]|nr:hypothetical protein [Gemmatimonadota bacterium]